MTFASNLLATKCEIGYCTLTHVSSGENKTSGDVSLWNNLVVYVLGPVNVTLQLNAKGKPFLAHTDKVKRYCADVMPKSWPKLKDFITERPSLNADPKMSVNTVPDKVREKGTLPFNGPSVLLHDRKSVALITVLLLNKQHVLQATPRLSCQ